MEIVLSTLNLQITLNAATLDRSLFTTLLHSRSVISRTMLVP
jgi:hypothetical protein